MRFLHILTPLAVMAMGLPAMAQESPWALSAKFGAGASFTNNDDQGSRATIGYSGQIEYRLTNQVSLLTELTYRTFRAQDLDLTKVGPGYRIDNGAIGTISLASSVDSRKNTLEGYGLNIGASYMLQYDFSIRGGLSLNHMISQQEVIGEIQVVSTPAPPPPLPPFTQEGMNFTPAKRGMYPGAFVGLRKDISDLVFFETNMSYIKYKMANYLPSSYTGLRATTEYLDKSKVIMDFRLGIKF